MDWKKVGLISTGIGGLGYLAYKRYRDAQEKSKEEYARAESKKAAQNARESQRRDMLQERLIEEMEQPFEQFCEKLEDFSFSKQYAKYKDLLQNPTPESNAKEAKTLDSSPESSAESSSDEHAKQALQESLADTQETSPYDRERAMIGEYIKSFTPSSKEWREIVQYGDMMFDNVSRAKPFAKQIQDLRGKDVRHSAESEPDKELESRLEQQARELIWLYEEAATTLSGDRAHFPSRYEWLWWSEDMDEPEKKGEWRHDKLCNLGLMLPLQLCMMKHLHAILGIGAKDSAPKHSLSQDSLPKDSLLHAAQTLLIWAAHKSIDHPASKYGLFWFMTCSPTPRRYWDSYGEMLANIARAYLKLLMQHRSDEKALESALSTLSVQDLS